jgi:hypothetical protein
MAIVAMVVATCSMLMHLMVMLVRVVLLATASRKEQCCAQTSQGLKVFFHILIFKYTKLLFEYKDSKTSLQLGCKSSLFVVKNRVNGAWG